MMTTHVLINQLRGDKSRKRSARDALWKAQGGDSFYRTAGGGIYRNTVRNAAYRALLEAERITRERGVFIPSVMPVDFDLDGEEEYLFQDEHINCYAKTLGASVFELDYLPKTWNYLSGFALREENPGSGSPNAAQGLGSGFVDYLGPPDLSLDSQAAIAAGITPASPNKAADLDAWAAGGHAVFPGRFCGGESYVVQDVDKTHEKVSFRLPVNSALPFGFIEIEKTYQLKKDVLTVRYRFANRGAEALRFSFVSRLNLAFPGEGEGYQRILKLGADAKDALSGAEGEIRDTGGIELWDLKNEVTLTLSSDQNFDVRILPLKISCPVYGEEQWLYQSTCVLPVKIISLESGASWETEYRLKLSHHLRRESGGE
jgi:hypothetical protein